MIAPFTRNLKLGSNGRDVLAVARALVNANYGGRGMVLTNHMGRKKIANLNRFKKAHGLPANGIYDIHTHLKLKKYFDPYGCWLLQHTVIPKPHVVSKRDIIVATALFGSANRYQIHYTMGSARMYGVRHHVKPPRVPYYEDCSSYATWCYWVAGAPDPNHLGYSGYGYTGTLVSHGSYTNNPRPGDLAFYGRGFNGAPKHVTVYIGAGKCISHGSEAGPYPVSLHYRGDYRECRSYLP